MRASDRDWPALFKDAAERGLGVREFARELGVNNTAIYQAERQHGITLPRRVEKSPPTTVAAYVQDGTEQWRPVPGFERYAVSSLGRFRNVTTGKLLTLAPHPNGYLGMALRANGAKVATKKWAHRWVALAFISNPEGLPQVNHIDHQRTNNVVENLEWTTRAQNYQHSHERSLSRSNGKVRSKLTPDDVAAIYAAKPKKWKSPGNGAIAADLATKYGVNFHLIGKIWRGERRVHDSPLAAQTNSMSRACGPEDK